MIFYKWSVLGLFFHFTCCLTLVGGRIIASAGEKAIFLILFLSFYFSLLILVVELVAAAEAAAQVEVVVIVTRILMCHFLLFPTEASGSFKREKGVNDRGN